ncbi:family 10 glycosylhydrolase [Alkalinema sp. FACHB-956]|uniref:glycoside hydrolase family 10 protein n=1 Tax=Alkalinema sp. FACHB-956 TaxID=2692768 RepID=UPI0016829895|nr:family 10 glycosylhydrolase [Alkalinema sp. FACHB-956]MBD2327180.1 family 10 glycosylhydrolase [Alkalinema sp. FACHB-956]
MGSITGSITGSIMACELSLSLFLSPSSLAQSPAFSDLSGHWAAACITNLNETGIISGYPDRTFRPDTEVSRAAFAAMVTKAFPQMAPVRSAQTFRDVPAAFWGAAAIQQAYRAGFFSGFPDGTFRPNAAITRAQALTALASGSQWKAQRSVKATLASLKDAQTIPSYAEGAIAAALEKGVVVNYPEAQKLNADRVATRAELAAFLCQALPSTNGLIAKTYLPAIPNSSPAQCKEIRSVWLTNIDSDVFFDADRLKLAIQTLHAQGFNTIYPAVWNWGYTLYPSEVMQRKIGLAIDPRPAGLQGRDVLQEMITEAHRLGMTVVPWFEFGFMAPADSELAAKAKDWLAQTQTGETTWLEGSDVRVWLSPFRSEVQQFILDLVTEIVGRYDVDGIQFDDHFGLPVEFGYEAATVALYQKENGGKQPPKAVNDAGWVRWRADKMTQVMTKVFKAVKAKNPKAKISLSPNPYSFAYNKSLQDWRSWERQGLIEELIVQVYKDSFAGFDRELTQPEFVAAQKHIPTGVGILSGLRGKKVPMTQIQQQVKATRDRGYGGVSFFFYETLWNMTGESASQRKADFKELLEIPPINCN